MIVIRPGAARSLGVELRGLTAAVAGALLLGVAGGGLFALGGRAERGREAERVAELEGEVARLTEENAKVARLAGRLDSVEAKYRRLQRVMSGDIAPSGKDILLPRLGGGGERGMGGGVARPYEPTMWPLAERGFVTRSFGDTAEAPFGGHVGVDIAVPEGSYVRASGAGQVTEVGEDTVYGRYIRVGHAGGLSSLYAHNSWLFYAAGDSVQRGEVIALTGNTGSSTAPHLHFEIERAGAPVDPLEFVSGAR